MTAAKAERGGRRGRGGMLQNDFAARQNDFAARKNRFAARQNGLAARKDHFAARKNHCVARKNDLAARQNALAARTNHYAARKNRPAAGKDHGGMAETPAYLLFCCFAVLCSLPLLPIAYCQKQQNSKATEQQMKI